VQQTSTTQSPAAQPQPPAAQPQPFVVKVIRPPEAAETTVGDVIFGSLGIAGVLLVIALLLGGVMAAIRVGWHRLRPPADNHLPPVSPLIADPTDPRSSQSR
jgi:hypothetical protein